MNQELKVGDEVIVTGRAPSCTMGWADHWVSDMDKYVGRSGVITRIHSDMGVMIDFGDGSYRNYNFPRSVLRCWWEPSTLFDYTTSGFFVPDEVVSLFYGGLGEIDSSPKFERAWDKTQFEKDLEGQQVERALRFVERKKRLKDFREMLKSNLHGIPMASGEYLPVWRYQNSYAVNLMFDVANIRNVNKLLGRGLAKLIAFEKKKTSCCASANSPSAGRTSETRKFETKVVTELLPHYLNATNYGGHPHLLAFVRDVMGDDLVCCAHCGSYDLLTMSAIDTWADNSYCGECVSWDRVAESSLSGWVSGNAGRIVDVFMSAEEIYENDPSSRAYLAQCQQLHRMWRTDASGSRWAERDIIEDYCDEYEFDIEGFEELNNTDGSGVAGYHRAERDFTERTSGGWPALGVELEVQATTTDRNTVARAIRKRWPMGCEKDGSLCESTGFEIVSSPYGKHEWETVAPPLLELLHDRGVRGYNADGGMYGIHVTIHRRHLSPLAEVRMFMFLTAEENRAFVQAVSQRCEIFHADIHIGQLEKKQQRIRSVGGMYYVYNPSTSKEVKKMRGLGKYSPLNLKPELAEFRMFQSTTYLPSFMKNLEFIWALWEWTKPATCSGVGWNHEDFVKWLAARPNVTKDYPNLVAHLLRESYVVKGGSKVRPIHNSWAVIMLNAGRQQFHALEAVDETAQEEVVTGVEIKDVQGLLRRALVRAA